MKTLSTFILLIILVLAYLPAPKAQEISLRKQRETRRCGTTATAKDYEVAMARMRQIRKNRDLNLEAQALDPPTDAPYYIPLSIHIVRNSQGNGGLALNALNRAMEDLNRIWQPVGVQFFIYGNIDYINDTALYYLPGGDSAAEVAARNALRLTNPYPNTVNVYFTNIAGLLGESTFSTDPVQGVLMDNKTAGVVDNPSTPQREDDPSTFAHEIGHYFDIPHTHHRFKDEDGNLIPLECPDGSNCDAAGDLLCDTPADPNLDGKVDASCNYTGSVMGPAGCGNTPYNPPTRNVMSYSLPVCSTQFTPKQIEVALYSLRNQRPNLITKGARYVDPLASPSNEECTYNSPCQLIRKAVEVAQDGDFIFIKPAFNHVSKNSPLDGKRVTLMRWGTTGEVNITN